MELKRIIGFFKIIKDSKEKNKQLLTNKKLIGKFTGENKWQTLKG